MPITQSILDVARVDPQRIAIADAQTEVTYGELVERSPGVRQRVQQLLEKTDVREIATPEDIGDIPVVAISLKRALDAATLVAVLAGYRLISSVLDPKWPVEHRVRSVEKSGTRVLITDDESFITALNRKGWRGVSAQFSDLTEGMPAEREILPSARSDDEPFTLIFTSGTTDLPKGFLRTRSSWRYNVGVSRTYLRCVSERKTLAPGPLSYSLTLYALIEVLGTGGSIWLQSTFDSVESVKLIELQRIERYVGVPAMLPALTVASRRRSSALESLKHVIVGGANLSEALRDGFEKAVPQADLISYYGAAEIGFIGQSFAGEGAALHPFAGVELSVRDEEGNEVAAGEVGRLHVRVDSQGDRYISTTGGASITAPDGWATVNDYGSLRDGLLTLEGRAGDIAVTGGHKVSLLQVERALEAVPGCERCCVVTQPDSILGSVLVAVIESSHTAPLDSQAMPPPDHGVALPSKRSVLSQLRESLPPQFVPKRLYFAEQLPRTVGGKIRRGETQKQLEAGAYTRW